MPGAHASRPLRLVCLSADDELGEELENALAPFGDAVRLSLTDPQNPDLTLVAEADALLCRSLSAEVRAHAAALKWIQFWSAGVDGKLTPELFEGGVQIASGSGIRAAPCSEHVLALMLAFARGLPRCFEAQQARDWSARGAIGDALFELEGKTVGIVGAGTIGQAIGVRCQAFGMRTIGIRRDPSKPAHGIEVLLPLIRYHDLILASDFVVLALPLTPQTRMIFGEDEIEIIKKSAYVFNVGRGALVDQPRLLQALQKRWIAGAGLDVFADEPLPPDSPFWSLPNCIITPHIGGVTPHHWQRFARLAAQQVDRWRNGEPLLNRVDKDRGY
jgi:phosphoglycerate dehydrogenase-like enzyme